MNGLAARLRSIYGAHPADPDGFEAWRQQRDDLLGRVYGLTGADSHY